MHKKSTQVFSSPALKQLSLFSRYWWVVLFVVTVYCGYAHSMSSKQAEMASLQKILASLEEQKQEILEENTMLLLHKQSRDDKEYIKMLLRKNLGLVTKGQTKVTFE